MYEENFIFCAPKSYLDNEENDLQQKYYYLKKKMNFELKNNVFSDLSDHPRLCLVI